MATGNMQETRRARCKREHFIQHTTFVHGRRLGGYTFEACIFGTDQVGVEEVVEVDILATVVEVVVHISVRK